MKLITTSWDDGHPADFRVAELLQKYELPGSFYIPKNNEEHPVMDEAGISELSRKFEIGGHTLNHIRIRRPAKSLLESEILGCSQWLTDLLGQKPVSFCFPGGVFQRAAVNYTFQAGFKIIRSTELLNNGFAMENGVIGTTLQLFPHSSFTYCKHLLKRFKFGSLQIYLRGKLSSDLLHLSEYYLERVLEKGGCFHLWGHSWEIEQNQLWSELEMILKMLSGISEINYVQNQALLKYYGKT